MKKIIALIAATLVALCTAYSSYAMPDPDAPGTKLITIQAGGLPGFGGLLTGSICMANLGKSHLYGGLQLGANYRHGAALATKKLDASLAPRISLGFNLGRVVEIHFGGLAGIDAQRFDELKSSLVFCYGGFGGLRFNLGPTVGIVLEGCYSNCLPYASGGLSFRF